MFTKFKDYLIYSYFVLPLRVYNLTAVTYFNQNDNIQQINKICSLIYLLRFNSTFYDDFSSELSLYVNLYYSFLYAWS